MIKGFGHGDITSADNHADIIIGMNSQLKNVTGIGRRFIETISPTRPIDLGGVISFQFDEQRLLHMLICHHLGKDGWIGSDSHVRFGLDHLWQRQEYQMRMFSIVQIGTGPVGLRDGANAMLINSAIATSFLPVTLYIRNPLETEDAHDLLASPLVPVRAWHPRYGEKELSDAA